MNKLDLLVFAAHPDDAELACSGLIAKLVSEGKKVGIVDLTQGEMGTRGSVEIRKSEVEKSSAILGLSARINLGLKDGFIDSSEANKLKVIKAIRQFRPEIMLINNFSDRHPDHGAAYQLLRDSSFLSGLAKIITYGDENTIQTAWRPKNIYQYIQDRWHKPDFVVDISEFWPKKLAAIQSFSSQFYDINSKEEQTYISTPLFMEYLESRAKEMGHLIGVQYGEGFLSERTLGVQNLFNLV
jgi:N-acetylglucosamine malate deacetylase 1